MFLLQEDIFPWDLAILLLLAGSLCAVFLSVAWVRRLRRGSLGRVMAKMIGFLAALAFIIVIYGSFIEPQMLCTTHRDVAFPFPDRLKIAVISDTHVGPYKSEAFLKRVVQKTNDALPDIIILTGDYFFTAEAKVATLEPLRNLRASLGIFAVFGNHDTGHSQRLFGYAEKEDRETELRKLFAGMGITALENDHKILRTAKGTFAVAGVEDVWTGRSHVTAALKNIPEGTPVILAAHTPDVLLEPASQDANLIVTGHTHGGQIRLPFWGALAHIPIRVSQQYDQGLFAIDADTTMAITRGVGESSPRARLFAWPEVMVLRTR